MSIEQGDGGKPVRPPQTTKNTGPTAGISPILRTIIMRQARELVASGSDDILRDLARRLDLPTPFIGSALAKLAVEGYQRYHTLRSANLGGLSTAAQPLEGIWS